MGDKINYAALPNHVPQNCDSREACGIYKTATSLRESLWDVDPVQDGSLTKAEVAQHLRGIQWEELFRDYQKFYTKFSAWKASCLRGGVFYPQRCNSSLLSYDNAITLADVLETQGTEFFSIIGYFSKGSFRNQKMPAQFHFSWIGKNVSISGAIQTGCIMVTAREWHVDFGRLHLIKEVKIVRLGKTGFKMVVSHYSGKETVLVATWDRVYFLKNPTMAQLSRKILR